MNKAAMTRWIVVLAWSLGVLSPFVWAQGGWPEDPSDPQTSDCGNQPPDEEDPSPGDGNDCWEYKESDGWVRLFECIEEIECPEVECDPVPDEGCACLKVGDSATFSFTMPDWTVTEGQKTTEPDNPDCGDATEEDIVPGEEDSWEVTGGGNVASVSPQSGSGDADFTVTALSEGCASFTVTWKFTLSMEEDCPKEFSEGGPSVSVCVVDPNPSKSAPRGVASRAAKGGGDCEVEEVDIVFGNGGAIPPTISLNSTCTKECKEDEQDCTNYKLVAKAEMADAPVLTVATKIQYNAPSPFPPHLLTGTSCDRDPDRIKESKEHEQKHCEGYMAGVKAVIAFVEGHALNNKVYGSCDECQEKAKILIDEAKALWEQLLESEMNHNTFAGQDRPCSYNGDALDGETPCETDKRKCGTYDPNNPRDKGYANPKWEGVDQGPCK